MSNPIFADRIQETFTTTGTGTLSLGGPITGYAAFSSALTTGETAYYTATDGTNWEVGLGTYSSSGDTLARTTVLASSNGGSAVNWAAGTKSIFLGAPASVLGGALQASNNLSDVGTLATALANLGFAQSLGSPGYIKLPGGLIIQWGVTPTITHNSSGAVTFGTAFPNAVFGIVLTNNANGTAFGYYTSPGTTGFTCYNASNSDTDTTFTYLAWGN